MDAAAEAIQSVLASPVFRDHGMLVFVVAVAALYFLCIAAEPRERGAAPGADGVAPPRPREAAVEKDAQSGGKALTKRAMVLEERLARPRSVTLGLTGSMLRRDGAGILRMVDPDAAAVVADMATFTSLYLVVRCREEADAKAALQALREARVLHSSDVPEHRVLFATTERGHCAIARQVAPSCVVDTDPEVIRYMAPHTSRCVLLSSGPAVADLPALRWASLLELATEGESR